MTRKIDKKITGYAVKTAEQEAKVEVMTPLLKREAVVYGATYKIKPPQAQHAIYVTVNKQGGSPIELFINSQDVAHHQWVQTITRLVSAIFRKGGDIGFVVDELAVICDPNGGYWGKDWVNGDKKKFYPSVVAEISCVLDHFLGLGAKQLPETAEGAAVGAESGECPPHAVECKACKAKAAVVVDGCLTCLNCGDSKCG